MDSVRGIRTEAPVEFLKFDMAPNSFRLWRPLGQHQVRVESVSADEHVVQVTQICGRMNKQRRKTVRTVLRSMLPAYSWAVIEEDLDDAASAILRELENDALLCFLEARLLVLLPSGLMWEILAVLTGNVPGYCGTVVSLIAQEQHPLTALRLTTPSDWDLQSFCLLPGASMVVEFGNEIWTNR